MSRNDERIQMYTEGNTLYLIGESGKRAEIEMAENGQDRVIIDTLSKYFSGGEKNG